MSITFSSEAAKLEQWDVYLLQFLRVSTTLSGDLTAAATAVSGADIDDLPNLGYIVTEAGEIIEYDLKTFLAATGGPGWLRVSRRGAFNTTAASAASGETIAEPFLDKEFWTSATHNDLGSNHPYLKVPRGVSQKLKSGEGQTSIGNMTFTIVDEDNEFSKIAAIVPMRNREVTLKAGFENLPSSAFEVEFKGLFRDMSLSRDHNEWVLTVKDLKRLMRKELFTTIGKSALAASAAATGTTQFSVDSIDGTADGDTAFIDPDDFPYDSYIRINDEIMGPVKTISGTTIELDGLGSRGQFNTIAADHDIDSDVTQAFVLGPANPITMALEILLSTGTGNNHATYDVLPETMGMGAASADVDIASFESERDTFITATNFYFYITDEIRDGKSWIEKNLLKTTNSFIFVIRDGRISFKVAAPPIPTETPMVLDSDSIKGFPSFSGNLPDIINQIKMLYNKDPFDDEYKKTLLVIDADSISRHGSSPVLEIKLDGVHGTGGAVPDQGGDTIAESIGKYYRSRLSEPQPAIKLTANMLKRGLNVGDLVAVTFDTLPDWVPNKGDDLTGRSAGATIMQVESIENRFDKAEITLGLIGTQYNYKRFGVIGPTGQPDYTSATEVQRQYAFWAGSGDDLMSNGDAAYLIYFGGGGATDTDIDFSSPITETIGSEFQTNDAAIEAEFDTTTGHNHNGSNSKAITSLPSDCEFEDNFTLENGKTMIAYDLLSDYGAIWDMC